MVTSAVWADMDSNGADELIIAGEWMPIRAFRFDEGAPKEITDDAGLSRTSGWWNVLLAHDWNGDGHVDLLAGNRGLNHTLRADEDHPLTLIADDFGYDGAIDPIMVYQSGGKNYPVAWRDELLEQIPSLIRSFPDYATYANATIEDILGESRLAEALRLHAYEFETCVFENRGDGTLRKRMLPIEAQFSPVNGAVVLDVNVDGRTDILLAGNNYGSRAQWGAQTSGRGALLLNEGDLNFRSPSPGESGFFAPGDVRRLALLSTQLGSLVVVVNNDNGLETFGVNYQLGAPQLARADEP
jgi:hypothetical protein